VTPQQKLPPVAQDSSAGWMHLQTFVCVFVSLTHYLHQLTPQLLAFEQFNKLSTCLSRAATHKKVGLGFLDIFGKKCHINYQTCASVFPGLTGSSPLELRNVRIRGLTFLGPRTHKKKERKARKFSRQYEGRESLFTWNLISNFAKRRALHFHTPRHGNPRPQGARQRCRK
jgi:hypothetical protein